MAEIKKYLDTTALGTLVDKIKEADAATLQSAKNYADGLATNYDAAGSAASALTSAKAYTDELANGQVKTNKEAIETLNGSGEGSVAKAIADTKALIDADIDAVEVIANKNKDDIAAINNSESGILAQSKAYADGEIAKVHGEVDALESYVGTFTASEGVDTIVKYIDAKTANIASDETVGALADRVTQAETDIDNIEKDYLKAADKTELEGKITAVETAVATEKSRAEGIESGLDARIKAVEDDYLKAADKTELQNNINTVSSAVELLTNGVDAEKVDGVNDLIKYVEEHGTEVTGMKADIAQNASDIDAVEGRLDTAEGKISGLEGSVATKAEKSYVDEQIEVLEGVDAGFETRIAAVEGKLGTGEGSVDAKIATAKQEAIDTAAGDATTKAGQALTDAKAYTDAEVLKDRARLDAIEKIEHHSHSNKAELDLIASGDKAKWDEAYGKAHEHGNKSVLDGITSDLVTKWNTVDSKADKTALDGAVERIAANEGAISTLNDTVVDKADTSALEAAVARIAQNETNIAANTSAINSFTAITAAEVEALFA